MREDGLTPYTAGKAKVRACEERIVQMETEPATACPPDPPLFVP